MSHTATVQRPMPFAMTWGVLATVALGMTVGCQATPSGGTGAEAPPDPTPRLEGVPDTGALALSFAPPESSRPTSDSSYVVDVPQCKPLEFTCPGNGFYWDHPAPEQCREQLLEELFPDEQLGLLYDYTYFCKNPVCTPDRERHCIAVKEILNRHYLSSDRYQSALDDCCRRAWWDSLPVDEKSRIAERTF